MTQSYRKERVSLTRCVLDLARQCSYSDERDRIYGMLGIHNELSIEPDYTNSPMEVCLESTSRSLQTGDLSVLHECCLSSTSIPGYPSYISALDTRTQGFDTSRSRYSIDKADYVPILIASVRDEGGNCVPAHISVDRTRHLRGTLIGQLIQKIRFTDSSKSITPRLSSGKPDLTQYLEAKPLPAFLSARASTWTIYQDMLFHMFGE